MNIEAANNLRQKRDFIKFYYQVYQNDPNFIDLNIGNIKNFLYQKDHYAKRCRVQPILAKKGNSILAQAILVSSNDSDELRISFLEFLPKQISAVKKITSFAITLAKKLQLKKVIIGIDGHISYGLGILQNNHTTYLCGCNYHPNYYVSELEKLKLSKKEIAHSYFYDFNKIKLSPNQLQSVLKNKQIRTMSRFHFKRDIMIFGKLCNLALQGTPHYSHKSPAEMYELIKPLRFLLHKENLLFIMASQKEVGFLFTHPNYTQLMPSGKINWPMFILNYLFRKNTINTLIFNTIGILPEYRHSSNSVALLFTAYQHFHNKYHSGISTFIQQKNHQAATLLSSFATNTSRKYFIYAIDINA